MHDLVRNVWRHSSKFQSFLVLLLMIAVMTALSDRFFTAANGWNIMRQISVNLCLSIGMTMVIVAGGIDLSVGSLLALVTVIGFDLIKGGMNPLLGVILMFGLGGLIGCFFNLSKRI